ncbi:hypothetical protein B0O99DRAFT_589913 [Bisporella sp. PMI_857]|nr:hypothetical protein B0O99DRAFT_589913 [Bisporella sp. PMI_857]
MSFDDLAHLTFSNSVITFSLWLLEALNDTHPHSIWLCKAETLKPTNLLEQPTKSHPVIKTIFSNSKNSKKSKQPKILIMPLSSTEDKIIGPRRPRNIPNEKLTIIKTGILESIWSQPGLSKLEHDNFYTSLYFLDKTDPVRPKYYTLKDDESTQTVGAAVNSPEGRTKRPIDSQLLDQLALIFARYKASRLPQAGGRFDNMEDNISRVKGITANVTATALQFSSTQKYTIHIAKNGGEQKFDSLQDLDLRDKIVDWYNRTGGTNLSLPKRGDSIWKDVLKFWMRRESYYYDQLLPVLPWFYPEYGLGSAKQPLGVSNHDWKQTCEILGVLKEIEVGKGSYEEKIQSFVNYICFSESAAWEFVYPKANRKSTGEGVVASREIKSQSQRRAGVPDTIRRTSQVSNWFRKIVKWLKLLRTPRSLFDKFIQFQKEHPGVELELVFTIPPDVPPLPVNALLETVKSWKGLVKSETHTSKQAKTFGMDRNLIEKMLTKMVEKGELIPRSFHCELQLLNKFMISTPNDVHSHFGCSKDSCYLCWRFLKHSRYTTKGTHSTIHVGCAFPFTPPNGDQGQFLSLVNVMKELQLEFTDVIQKKSLRIPYNLTKLPAKSQTTVDNMTYTSTELSLPPQGESDATSVGGMDVLVEAVKNGNPEIA